jgi:ribosome-associated protein
LTRAPFRVTIQPKFVVGDLSPLLARSSAHYKGGHILEPDELARMILDLISDKKGVDILLMDTRAVSSIADYFVIATGESERQLKAMSDEIQKQMKKHKILPLGVEGKPDTGWILLDYGSVIVHLFSAALRDFYQLEQVWAKAPVVVRMQ